MEKPFEKLTPVNPSLAVLYFNLNEVQSGKINKNTCVAVPVVYISFKKKSLQKKKQKTGTHPMGHYNLKQREMGPHMFCHPEVRSLNLAVL